ncbi:MAG: hypothetical protein ACRCST_06600 [Turicibacter sp.]
MRKSLPMIIIFGVAILLLGFSLTYDIPEVEAFQFFQNIDQKIATCENKNDQTLESTLEDLQLTVRELIVEGQTYNGQTDVSKLLEKYNTQYEQVKQYTQSVFVCISDVITETDFTKVEKTTKKLSPELVDLANEMVVLQQGRTSKLATLKDQLDNLVKTLDNFEEMFYNTKTSDTVQYFQNVNNSFQEVQTIHSEYMTTVETYYQAKESYYEQIASKGTLDFIFKK